MAKDAVANERQVALFELGEKLTVWILAPSMKSSGCNRLPASLKSLFMLRV